MHRLSDTWPTWHVHYILSAWPTAISHFPALSSSLPHWSIPEAYSNAFSVNLSLSELISQPLPVFRVSVSHLYHACLTFPWCLPEATVYPTLLPFLFSQSVQWHERQHSRWLMPAGFVWFLLHFPLQFLLSWIFSRVLSALIYFDLFSASVFLPPSLYSFQEQVEKKITDKNPHKKTNRNVVLFSSISSNYKNNACWIMCLS